MQGKITAELKAQVVLTAMDNIVSAVGDSPKLVLCWTEDNRLQAFMERGEEGGVAAWYNYTADGTRNFKLRSPRLNIQQNASLFDSPPLVYPTLYASPLITLTQSGYTKHYFEEGHRICSKLGGGFADRVPSGEIDARVNEIEHSYAKLSQYQHDGVMESFTNCFGATPVLADRYDLRMMLRDYRGDERLFFYHNDHLGSAAYITDESSQVTQTLNYLPYGEDWVEVRNDFDPRIGHYTFNGKEKDYESGFHYYGARYYWSELLTGWLSVDPMIDKYPNISPYAYCAWNPVKLVDPDGRDFDPTMEEYASQVERYCDIRIKYLSGMESLTDEQRDQLSELQSAKKEIGEMRDDHSTYYCLQSGSFKEKRTKGITQYYGSGEFTRKGEQQHKIMVSLNVECGLFIEKGRLNMKGLQVLGHELKHCYQFYNKESLYILSADGSVSVMYNTRALEKAAFERAAAFGSLDRFDDAYYPDLSSETMDEFIQNNPGTVIKHK